MKKSIAGTVNHFIVICAAVISFALTHAVRAEASNRRECAALFKTLPADPIEAAAQNKLTVQALRTEIHAANLHDRASGRDGAEFSNFIDGRAADIRTPAPGYTVVSLGSGPDIFLPLYLHPTAQVFHLVDGLGGWGHGPDAVIEEIEVRLHAISRNVDVQRLDSQGNWRQIEGFLQGPLIWRARWISPTQGLQEKTFFLHQANFDDLKQMHDLNFKKVGGIVITGIAPSFQTHYYMMSLLIPDGSLFTEAYESTRALNEKLRRDFDFIDHGEQAYAIVRNSSRAYEFRRKRNSN